MGASHSYLDIDLDNDELYNETALMASNVSQPMFQDQPAVTPLKQKSESRLSPFVTSLAVKRLSLLKINPINRGDYYANQVL